jgi:hypothetical protein
MPYVKTKMVWILLELFGGTRFFLSEPLATARCGRSTRSQVRPNHDHFDYRVWLIGKPPRNVNSMFADGASAVMDHLGEGAGCAPLYGRES